MEERVKLALLEDMMDLDEGELNADTNLAELDSWDSMAKLSLIVLMDEEFSVKLEGDKPPLIQSLSPTIFSANPVILPSSKEKRPKRPGGWRVGAHCQTARKGEIDGAGAHRAAF